MHELVLISCPGQDSPSERIRKLAECMGVQARTVSVSDQASIERLVGHLDKGGCRVAVSAAALTLLRTLAPPDVLRRVIEEQCAAMLIFVAGSSRHHMDSLRWLTDGGIAGLSCPQSRQDFHFPDGGRRFSGVFARQGFILRRTAMVPAFDLANPGDQNVTQILLAGGEPVFLRMQRGACEIFLLAAEQIVDIEEPLSQARGMEDQYDQLLPLLIFLRHCFGEMCWHGTQRTARLIIDDPLLVQKYGCLSFGALRNSMRSAGYGTSIAFIPWNQWRTSKSKADTVIDGSPELSICVHGCDHTNREFDDLDPGSLQWKADTALRRMDRHWKRTGLPFDPVMVPPQGKFASPALSAFRASGYLAAVNSTCFPTNGETETLTIADLLRPAITKFYGFPLFQRRYPGRLVDFAFDLFVGRPVLVVQHHDDFRDGYRQFEEFVAGLYRLEPALTWGPLADQLMQSCMVRSLGADAMEVRFFTSRFTFENRRPQPVALVFSKAEPDPSAISDVLVDGEITPFSIEGGVLAFEHLAAAGQVVDIRILDKPGRSTIAHNRPGLAHAASVLLRRALSEFRDKTLVKHPRLLAIARGLAARMKATGDSPR
jgi:hypothetical protein